MIILDEITSISADRLRCRITRNGVCSELTVKFTQDSSGIESLNFEGMLEKERFEFVRCEGITVFVKILWTFFRGEFTAELPVEITSDWEYTIKASNQK